MKVGNVAAGAGKTACTRGSNPALLGAPQLYR